MTRRSLYFVGPRELDVRESPIPEPDSDELRVRTDRSAISPGTELLVYTDTVPETLSADIHLDALSGSLSYPLTYGYAAVGHVEAVGEAVDDDWVGKRVFAFNPHESHFCAPVDQLHAIPDEIPTAAAPLLPSVETACTLVHDGNPRLGERVVVFGQGLIGLTTTALLAEFPIELITVDPIASRRQLSEQLGATESLAPAELDAAVPYSPETTGDESADTESTGDNAAGVDLCYELSGNPAALDSAIGATGYDGRVIVGSWYGTKHTELDLGGRFHRSRISISSSQVSTIDPSLRGRWNRSRRMALAWDRLTDLPVEKLLTHQYPIESAPEAYARLAERDEDTLGICFTYERP